MSLLSEMSNSIRSRSNHLRLTTKWREDDQGECVPFNKYSSIRMNRLSFIHLTQALFKWLLIWTLPSRTSNNPFFKTHSMQTNRATWQVSNHSYFNPALQSEDPTGIKRLLLLVPFKNMRSMIVHWITWSITLSPQSHWCITVIGTVLRSCERESDIHSVLSNPRFTC